MQGDDQSAPSVPKGPGTGNLGVSTHTSAPRLEASVEASSTCNTPKNAPIARTPHNTRNERRRHHGLRHLNSAWSQQHGRHRRLRPRCPARWKQSLCSHSAPRTAASQLRMRAPGFASPNTKDDRGGSDSDQPTLVRGSAAAPTAALQSGAPFASWCKHSLGRTWR